MLGITGEEFKDKTFNDNDVIKFPIRTSDKIKCCLMKFLRIEKQFDCVCTEGVRNADISAIKAQKLIEVEIKISKSDFKNELKHKKTKHDIYKNITNGNAEWMKVPNKFYFCVTKEMEEWALKEIDKIDIRYGLMVWQDNGDCGSVYIRRKAMHLHTTKINNFMLIDFCKRMTSELMNLKLKDMNFNYI